MMLMH